jgi:hypothetical protein
MKNKLKTNRICRLTIITLIFTLVSTSMLSFTLAKYTTGGGVVNHARVAKWGVRINFGHCGNTLFKPEYRSGNGTLSAQWSGGIGGADNLIAPGTSGSTTFSVTGNPEVAVEISVCTGGSQMVGAWSKSGPGITYHEPIRWSLSKDDETILNGGSFQALCSALENLSGQWDANSNLDDSLGEYTISWTWPLNSGGMMDDYETYLGDVAAAGSNIPGYVFRLTITATQIG